jgi:hypothetical protein
MTPNTTQTDATDTRSVETAWAETIQAELPLDGEDEARKYANFLFGNPLFTIDDVGPDAAVVLIDDLLDRHPPTEFFGVEGSLSTDEWATLKGTLVDYLAEGVDGERPGPASAFPDAPALEEGAGGAAAAGTGSPDTTVSPKTTNGVESTTPGVGVGLADEGIDPGELDMAGLYDAVAAEVEAAELDVEAARATLRRVREDHQADDVDLKLYVTVARMVLASPAESESVDRALGRAIDRDIDED